ncbi:hypothetical protein I8J29_31650 [Paenibacillus sp. MWE-103]|uniref:Uncharacterized protein n=1 Tax=Paenibacillus artemisiicola TaxID=1172618 RepID=A0ABS3WK89_9BACL|nr:hypothetical protein [Paenibacillus artemisiicola]MBO7748734.1 hypothetical protein [Paenibacillus artemisiicola]
MYKLAINREQIWNGCILASIAHAVMTAHYPDFSFEQSWDGINYNVQDGAGIRGTITFHDRIIVAAFRKEQSDRLYNSDLTQTAIRSLHKAPPAVHAIAKSETFHCLLDEVDGQTIPLITALFYGVSDDFVSNDSLVDLFEHGAEIIQTQLLGCTDEAIKHWHDYYEMTQEQSDLVLSLFHRKLQNPKSVIRISQEEATSIGLVNAEGIDECRESLEELGIIYPM